MKEKKHRRPDPVSTLVTLDQLSQTIEVMTNVVNRLRDHLSEQILQKSESEIKSDEGRSEEKDLPTLEESKTSIDTVAQELSEKIQEISEKSVVVEIRNGHHANDNDEPTTLH